MFDDIGIFIGCCGAVYVALCCAKAILQDYL